MFFIFSEQMVRYQQVKNNYLPTYLETNEINHKNIWQQGLRETY